MVRGKAVAKLLAVSFSLLAVCMVAIHCASSSSLADVLVQKKGLMEKAGQRGSLARQQVLLRSICLAAEEPVPAACAWHPKPKRPASQDFQDMYAASLGSRVSEYVPEDVPYPYYAPGDHPTLSRVSDPATRGLEAYLQLPDPVTMSPELQEAAANGALTQDPLVRRIMRGAAQGADAFLGGEAARSLPAQGMDESGQPRYDALQDPEYRWMMANKNVGFMPDDLGRLMDDIKREDEEEAQEEAPAAPEPPADTADAAPEHDMGRPSSAGWHVSIFPFHGFPAHAPPALPKAEFPYKHWAAHPLGLRKRWNIDGNPIDAANVFGR